MMMSDKGGRERKGRRREDKRGDNKTANRVFYPHGYRYDGELRKI